MNKSTVIAVCRRRATSKFCCNCRAITGRAVGGFTLIELLVTLTIAVILLTVAIPGLQGFLLQGRLSGHVNDLVLAMASAKSEAVKRGANVTLCASSDASTCTGAWGDGWVIRSNAGQVLQVHSGYQGVICATANSIAFRSSGFPVAGITFDLYDSRGTADGRRIAVSAQGWSTTTQGATTCP